MSTATQSPAADNQIKPAPPHDCLEDDPNRGPERASRSKARRWGFCCDAGMRAAEAAAKTDTPPQHGTRSAAKPTRRQVAYAHDLSRKAGYSHSYSSINQMTRAQVSAMIDGLRGEDPDGDWDY